VDLREKYSDRHVQLFQEMANDAGEFLHNKLDENEGQDRH